MGNNSHHYNKTLNLLKFNNVDTRKTSIDVALVSSLTLGILAI